MLLSTAYFPPVEFFALLAGNSVVYLEACENYCKQSWRNRCRILTSNGPMDLRVPVVHGADLYHTRIDQVLVDYSTPWVGQTEYAIESAYSSSPFFLYYRDELFSILDSHPSTLWELNMRLISFFCRKIGIAPEIRPTVRWSAGGGEDDYRQSLHPKRPPVLPSRPYWQVFRDKFGFVEGLSIMDLLFCEGPESICYLQVGK